MAHMAIFKYFLTNTTGEKLLVGALSFWASSSYLTWVSDFCSSMGWCCREWSTKFWTFIAEFPLFYGPRYLSVPVLRALYDVLPKPRISWVRIRWLCLSLEKLPLLAKLTELLKIWCDYCSDSIVPLVTIKRKENSLESENLKRMK